MTQGFETAGFKATRTATLEALADSNGFVLIEGAPGCGKSRLKTQLEARLQPHYTLVSLPYSRLSYDELLSSLAALLQLRYREGDTLSCLNAIRQHVAEQLRKGRPVALLIDDAQFIPKQTLTELATAIAADAPDDLALRGVMFSARDFHQQLVLSHIDQQLISRHLLLAPANELEMRAFISRAVAQESSDALSISDEALQAVLLDAAGSFRAAQQIVRLAVMETTISGQSQISDEVIAQVRSDDCFGTDNAAVSEVSENSEVSDDEQPQPSASKAAALEKFHSDLEGLLVAPLTDSPEIPVLKKRTDRLEQPIFVNDLAAPSVSINQALQATQAPGTPVAEATAEPVAAVDIARPEETTPAPPPAEADLEAAPTSPLKTASPSGLRPAENSPTAAPQRNLSPGTQTPVVPPVTTASTPQSRPGADMADQQISPVAELQADASLPQTADRTEAPLAAELADLQVSNSDPQSQPVSGKPAGGKRSLFLPVSMSLILLLAGAAGYLYLSGDADYQKKVRSQFEQLQESLQQQLNRLSGNSPSATPAANQPAATDAAAISSADSLATNTTATDTSSAENPSTEPGISVDSNNAPAPAQTGSNQTTEAEPASTAATLQQPASGNTGVIALDSSPPEASAIDRVVRPVEEEAIIRAAVAAAEQQGAADTRVGGTDFTNDSTNEAVADRTSENDDIDTDDGTDSTGDAATTQQQTPATSVALTDIAAVGTEQVEPQATSPEPGEIRSADTAPASVERTESTGITDERTAFGPEAPVDDDARQLAAAALGEDASPVETASSTDPTLAAEREALAAQVRLLLKKAEIHSKAYRFSIPEQDNAVLTYRRVLDLDPDNRIARDSLEEIEDRYRQRARTAMQQQNWAIAAQNFSRLLWMLPRDREARNGVTRLTRELNR